MTPSKLQALYWLKGMLGSFIGGTYSYIFAMVGAMLITSNITHTCMQICPEIPPLAAAYLHVQSGAFRISSVFRHL